ncbi:MAG: DNA polymerase IV [Proteobacteria bacterium]|nr:DNA polymerase IV [Pseudomonadota bacterium]
MSVSARRILHVDMDAFYASVEQRDNPDLQGKPVVVGGGTNRGVVAAASYEARRFGIRSAMPMAEAIRRCDHLVRVKPRMSHYKEASAHIFAIFREFTPLVEGLSLDEAFLDVTASIKLFGSPQNIAASIKQRVLEDTGLTASVGVAENKLVAKIASDLDKPDGLSSVMPDAYREKLDPLPVRVIPGIGRETLKRLAGIRIATLRDLRRADDRDLEPIFGRFTQKMRDRASGIDHRPVVSGREEKSISAEETYDRDLSQQTDMDRELLRLTERTATRLRRAALNAGTVQIKIRRADFTTYTRQRSISPPTNGTDQIYALAKELLTTWLAANPGARIRLLGVAGSKLAPAEQPDLFASDDTRNHSVIDETVDEIREKFGSLSVGRAKTLDR